MSGPFEGLLGNNCELRMLEYLLPLEGIEFNITELAEEVGVSRVTATRIVKKFADWGVLNSTRMAGITQYSINHESPVVKSIEQFNNVLIENILGDEVLYEIHDYWDERKPHAVMKPAAGTFINQPLGALIGLGDVEGLMIFGQREEALKQAPTCVGSPTEIMQVVGSQIQTPVFGGEI